MCSYRKEEADRTVENMAATVAKCTQSFKTGSDGQQNHVFTGVLHWWSCTSKLHNFMEGFIPIVSDPAIRKEVEAMLAEIAEQKKTVAAEEAAIEAMPDGPGKEAAQQTLRQKQATLEENEATATLIQAGVAPVIENKDLWSNNALEALARIEDNLHRVGGSVTHRVCGAEAPVATHIATIAAQPHRYNGKKTAVEKVFLAGASVLLEMFKANTLGVNAKRMITKCWKDEKDEDTIHFTDASNNKQSIRADTEKCVFFCQNQHIRVMPLGLWTKKKGHPVVPIDDSIFSSVKPHRDFENITVVKPFMAHFRNVITCTKDVDPADSFEITPPGVFMLDDAAMIIQEEDWEGDPKNLKKLTGKGGRVLTYTTLEQYPGDFESVEEFDEHLKIQAGKDVTTKQKRIIDNVIAGAKSMAANYSNSLQLEICEKDMITVMDALMTHAGAEQTEHMEKCQKVWDYAQEAHSDGAYPLERANACITSKAAGEGPEIAAPSKERSCDELPADLNQGRLSTMIVYTPPDPEATPTALGQARPFTEFDEEYMSSAKRLKEGELPPLTRNGTECSPEVVDMKEKAIAEFKFYERMEEISDGMGMNESGNETTQPFDGDDEGI